MASPFRTLLNFFGRNKADTLPAHPRPKVRRFEAAKQTNLTKSFTGSWGTADAEIIRDLPYMRARSRQMNESDSYFQAWIYAYLNNVLGPTGINFQCKIINQSFAGDKNDTADKQANDIVESYQKKVGSPKNFLVTRNMSRRAAERLIARSFLVDGEVFIRTLVGFKNDTRIARQIISAEMCDHRYNVASLPDGGQIRMGVELDAYGAPVAYHFLRRPVNDYQVTAKTQTDQLRERIPAEEIIHVFRPMRPGQTRGIPLAFAAMIQLRMLRLFEEAALINAKIGASRNIYYTKEYPEGWTQEDGPLTDNGEIIDDLKEGEALELPYGVKANTLDMRFPDAQTGPFVKAMLRGCACGLGMSYVTLSNDLEGTNFSSLRAGLNEERSNWASEQQWWIETVSQPEFETNLNFGLATQQIKLPPGRFEKYNKAVFTGRRWSSVNPLQDAQADAMLIAQRLKSPSQCIREMGFDPDEVREEIERDFRDMEAKDIMMVEGAPVEETEPDDDDTGEGKKPEKKPADKKDTH